MNDRLPIRNNGDVVKRVTRALTVAIALAMVAGCSGDDTSSQTSAADEATVVAPVTTPPAETRPAAVPAVDLRTGLFDCGPFFTKLGREMTYFVRLFDDGTMAEMMSRNTPDDVFTAFTERRSDDLSTDIGIGPFTISGDQFSGTTTDTLSYRIVYDGIVVSPTELRLRAVSALYDFDEQRMCTHLAIT
jgi:hypothetical protein